MKIAPIIKALQGLPGRLDKKGIQSAGLLVRLIHTGQHYDRNMSGSFFEQAGYSRGGCQYRGRMMQPSRADRAPSAPMRSSVQIPRPLSLPWPGSFPVIGIRGRIFPCGMAMRHRALQPILIFWPAISK